MKSLSFNKGLRAVRHGEFAAVKAELIAALGCKARQTYARRRDGKVMHTVAEAAAIEQVFANHGVADYLGA